jgi:hypothetical protein
MRRVLPFTVAIEGLDEENTGLNADEEVATRDTVSSSVYTNVVRAITNERD